MKKGNSFIQIKRNKENTNNSSILNKTENNNVNKKRNNSICFYKKILFPFSQIKNNKYGTSSIGFFYDENNNKLEEIERKNYFFPNKKKEVISINNINYELKQMNKKNIKQNKNYENVKYIYKQIFNKIFPVHKEELINNKLNLLYAEDENKFNERVKKLNLYLYNKGRQTINIAKEKKQVDEQIAEIKAKIIFMRGVSNYSYPKYIIHKIQRKIHYNKENSQKKDFFPPVEKINKIKLNKNKSFTNHLYQSINIINYKKY